MGRFEHSSGLFFIPHLVQGRLKSYKAAAGVDFDSFLALAERRAYIPRAIAVLMKMVEVIASTPPATKDPGGIPPDPSA